MDVSFKSWGSKYNIKLIRSDLKFGKITSSLFK